jgi:hypothetical protein
MVTVKKFASTIRKKRFSVKYPDGRIESYGTCREDEDERFGVIKSTTMPDEFGNEPSFARETKFFLAKYQLHDIDYSQPPKERTLLPEGTMICNNYYEHERDEWVTPEIWLKQV